MKKVISAILAAALLCTLSCPCFAAGKPVVGFENFKLQKDPDYVPGNFTDVDENAWYGVEKEGVIAQAWEYVHVSGRGDGIFDPDGTLTRAEAIKLAVVIHDIYNGGKGRLQQDDTPWYQVYVDYAVDKGIIKSTDFGGLYDKNVSREEAAYIFCGSMPRGALPQINAVSVPSDTLNSKYSDNIRILYYAGILQGREDGCFVPDSLLTRAEACALAVRMVLPEKRIHMEPEYSFTVNDHSEMIIGPITDIYSDDPGSGRRVVRTEDGGLYIWGGFDLTCAEGPVVQKYIGGKSFNYVKLSRFNMSYVDENGVLWGGSSHGKFEKLMENVKTGDVVLTGGVALKNDGTVWAWKTGGEPVQIMDKAVFAGCLGPSARYVIKENGELWGWGYIGIEDANGEIKEEEKPVLILEDVVQVSDGLALKKDGSVWGWGLPDYSAEPNGSMYPLLNGGKPVQFFGGCTIAESGGDVYAAVTENGLLMVMGVLDLNGSQGGKIYSEPIILTSDVKDVACGYEGILILKTNGELWEYLKKTGEMIRVPALYTAVL